jgi:glycosyltransferase involved in cell wall biosynthesis
LHRIHKVVCGNKRAAELVVEEGKFAGELPVLPQYGIDPNEYQPGTEPTLRAELGLSADIVIGYVGRLVPEKGIRLIFEALANLQWLPWKLLLIGAGPLEQEIRECWMPQFPGRVVLHPAVDYEAVARFMRCMDIFVLPSYATHCWAEQFGLTLAQAMMLGIPSVASRSGAIPDVLGPGGLLFREKNTQELAVALEALLNSAERRKEIGASGRAFALQNYTTAAVAKRYAAALFNAEERPEQAAAVSAIADM